MHPAYSIIFFTAASGLGYGLLAVAAVFVGTGWLPAARELGAIIILVGVVLVTAGLLSSTFHLGHPERAWRALTQFRSSWLSREGVAALLAYVPVAGLAWGWVWLGDVAGAWLLAAWLTPVLAAVTVYCTGMIYASLKAIPRWHHPLVPWLYVMLGLATGAVGFHLVVAMFGAANFRSAGVAIVSLLAAAVLKIGYWRSIDTADPVATAETATGLGSFGTVRPLDPPHTAPNYLQKEMGYRVARKHALKLRKITLVTLFAIPLIGVSLSVFAGFFLGAALAVIAALSVGLGILIERWLFFAEAVHVVTLYYGEKAA